MIAEQVTPDTAAKANEQSGFVKGANQAYAVVVAVGGIIMTVNACCYLYDRIKAQKTTPEEEEARQRKTAKVWAEENAKANADLFEAAAKAEAKKHAEEHAARLDALEASLVGKPAKKTSRKTAKKTS